MNSKTIVERCNSYDAVDIEAAFESFDALFAETVTPGQIVALKPNWIAPHHKYDASEWESVITHPHFITGAVKMVLRYLKSSGKIIIADAPQTDSSFKAILDKMPIEHWRALCAKQGVSIEVIDLRDHEWVNKGDVIIDRKELLGDPAGSVEYNLSGDSSEFHGHHPSRMGYYGADCDIKETTRAHSRGQHVYRVSKSIIDADVFINLPKLKTHKKAGLTCALKNLVGINTYKNFLPHHTEGTPWSGGDQFPDNDLKSLLEVYLLGKFKNFLTKHDRYSKFMVPVKSAGKLAFGETSKKIRSGNWYGNDTLWRMILDLNKLLLYGNGDGTMREDHASRKKKYLAFVDGIVGGEGNGPEAPSPISSKMVIGGCNPLAVDCLAAKLISFDYLKIPALRNAFNIKNFSIGDFAYDDICIASETIDWCNARLIDIPAEKCHSFKPHFGWVGHIECKR